LALGAIRSETEEVKAALDQLFATIGDHELFPRAKAKTAFTRAGWRRILGLRLMVRGEPVIAVRVDRLTSICRDGAVRRRLQGKLKQAQVLLPGHGGKSTRQPITLQIDGKALRPRFWLLDAKRLSELAAERDG
jgi:hypothetical protein